MYECSGRFALRCLVWHPHVHALVAGLQNGDIVRINVQTAPRLIGNKVSLFFITIRHLLKLGQPNIVRVDNLNGCINALALNGQGGQLVVSYDEEISLYDVSKFGATRLSLFGKLSEVRADAEEITHLHRLIYDKVEGVIPFISGIHYVDADILIVCFLDPRMGIV